MDDVQLDSNNSQSETNSDYEMDEEKRSVASGDEKPGLCYCGEERNLNVVELLCANCKRWFHEPCIEYQLGKLVPFITNYIFSCKNCSPTGLETFRKTQATFSQMCITAIANLQQNSLKEGQEKTHFNKEKDIIPYMAQHWEAMTTMPRRVTQSWFSTVQRSLMKDLKTVFVCEENTDFGLAKIDLTLIKPNYEAMARSGALRLTDDGQPQASPSKAGRHSKRRFGGGDTAAGKKGRPTSDASGNLKLSPHGYPLEHPYNKDGYRYILAEPDPHAPFRSEFDESPDWAGKPIPGWLYRAIVPNRVLLAMHDRAPQLKVAEDRLAVTGEKGYCMVRATHSVNRGRWYYEITIEEMPEGTATRLGWGQMYGNLQAPVGYDKFSYSWRSRKGTRFHESRGFHYTDAYGEGDTLGFLIELPEEEDVNYLPETYKDKPLVKFKSHLYYEDKDNVQETLKNLRVLPESKIEFFRNGQSQGVAFTNISSGSYYPSLSLFRNVTVSTNFGPTFKHPEVLIERNANGMFERAEELISEQSLSDVLYLTENDGKLRLDAI